MKTFPPSKMISSKIIKMQRDSLLDLIIEDYEIYSEKDIFLIQRRYSPNNLHLNRKVVLAHCLGGNGMEFIIGINGVKDSNDKTNCMANYLVANGFDVYMPSLRICKKIYENMGIKNEFGQKLSFDKLVEEDVPIIIQFASSNGHQSKLHWVGHSMGGMLMYGYLSRIVDERIASVATIASPVRFGSAFRPIVLLSNFLRYLSFNHFNFIQIIAENIYHIINLFLRLPKVIPWWILNYMGIYNWRETNWSTILTALPIATEPIPKDILEHVMLWAAKNKFISADSDIDYEDYLCNIKRTPFLFIYGLKDNKFACSNAIEKAFQLIATPYKDKIIFGVKEAGHIDLIVGENAKYNVWQPILKFMLKYS